MALFFIILKIAQNKQNYQTNFMSQKTIDFRYTYDIKKMSFYFLITKS